MDVAGSIVRHAKLVVALWIVVAIASVPLFASLPGIVKAVRYSLPSTSESHRADELLKKLGGSATPGIVIVEGVNLHDNSTVLKLVQWAVVYNRTFYERGLGSDLLGAPILLAKVNKTLYAKLLDVMSEAVKGAREAYRSLRTLNESYERAWEELDKAIEMLNESLRGVVEADKGLVQAYKGLRMLVNATHMVSGGLVELDRRLVEAVDELYELGLRLNSSAHQLQLLDSYAHLLKLNVTEAASRLTAVLGNNTIVRNVVKALVFTWWQYTRTYRYMEAFNGNYSMYVAYTNLTTVNKMFEPLPRDEAVRVWKVIKTLVAGGVNPDLAALKLVEETLEADKRVGRLAPLFVNVYEHLLRGTWARYNVESLTSLYSLDKRRAAETQLSVLRIAEDLGDKEVLYILVNSEKLAVKVIAESLVERGVDNETAYRLARQAVVYLKPDERTVLEAVLDIASRMYPEVSRYREQVIDAILDHDPMLEGKLAKDWSLAVKAAAELAASLGAPRDVVDAVVQLVAEKRLDRSSYAQLACRILAEKLREVMPQAITLIPLVEKYDPRAEGLLAKDRMVLANATLEALMSEASRRGLPVDREVLEKIVYMIVVRGVEPSQEQLRSLAFETVYKFMVSVVGREKAEVTIQILREYDPMCEGVLANNTLKAVEAVLKAAEKMGRKPPVNATVAYLLLKHPERKHEIFCNVFREEALKHAPKEALSLVEEAVDKLCSKGCLTDVEIWGLVKKVLLERASKEVTNVSRETIELMVDKVVKVARNESTLEQAVKKVVDTILLDDVLERIIDEGRGLLVANDLEGFILMFKPAGSTRDERANNTLEAAKLAEDTLRKFLGVVSVKAAGADLLMKEVHDYSVRDSERTSKISEVATFIVLFVILGSFLAVLMPYLGIGLGLVVGGAIVYLLAAKLGVIEVTSEAHTLMIVTALGLGADYAGYLVYRFREEYAREGDARKAAEKALRRAGPAIIASAAAVVIGFASLLLGWDLTFLRSLGETIPITIAATALASLTLVPALLALLGGKRWFWWPRRPRAEEHERESRVMKALLKHKALVLATLTIAMLVSAYFYINFHGSHDIKLMLPENAESVKAFNLLKKQYMPGVTDPIFVVLKLPKDYRSNPDMQRLVEQLTERIESVEGVGKVVTPNETGSKLVSSDGRIVALQVVLRVDPYSFEGEKAISKIHDLVHDFAEKHGIEAYMGGVPFAVLEMETLLHDRFYYRILPASATLMIITFTCIFGALLASIVALLVIVGAAMMGIMTSLAIFQWVLGKPILWFLHIVALAAVLGVGMDYNSFFLARALEESRKADFNAWKAMPRAAGAVSLFIIGLALVVTSAYMSLLASSTVGMREVGFTLGVTVLFAGVMASYLLTPLAVAALGKAAWWPRGTKKRLEH